MVFLFQEKSHNPPFPANTTTGKAAQGEEKQWKQHRIVRRVDDLGRIVIPKEIRRTLRIREGDPLLTSLTVKERFACAIGSLENNTFS